MRMTVNPPSPLLKGAYFLLKGASNLLIGASNSMSYKLASLTHISLASFLWDIGRQKSPRCDAAKRGVTSGVILFAYMNFIEK